MDLHDIHYCRECRFSHSGSIRNLKNAFLENEENLAGHNDIRTSMNILENYAKRNIIKKPQDLVRLARMAIDRRSNWKPGKRLTISFLGGKKEVRDRVIRHASSWMDHANIIFDFKPRKKNGDIRISFDQKDGSWSAVGTECLTIDSSEATMNLGWVTAALNDEEFRQVVLHEFGHALGCVHEHQRPDNGIPWDKKAVYAYYKIDKWTKEDVDEQVFYKYNENIIRANKLDTKSIMMYAVPEELTKGKYAVPWNSRLSPEDKKFIRKIYPA